MTRRTDQQAKRARGRPSKLGADVRQVAVKMGAELRARIAAAGDRMRAGVPGVAMSESDVCRHLLELGLAAFEAKHGPARE